MLWATFNLKKGNEISRTFVIFMRFIFEFDCLKYQKEIMMSSWQGWVALSLPQGSEIKLKIRKEEKLWAIGKSVNSKLPRNILSYKGHYVFILSSVLLIIIPLCYFHLFTIYCERADGLEKGTSVVIFGRRTSKKKLERRCKKVVLVLIIEWDMYSWWVLDVFSVLWIYKKNNNTSSWGMEAKRSICLG